MGTEKTIIDLFDPNNTEHIKAYKHLVDTGKWPDGFVLSMALHPAVPIFPVSWQVGLMDKIASCWVGQMTDSEEPTRSELNKALNDACKELFEIPLRPWTGCPEGMGLAGCKPLHKLGKDRACLKCWRQYLLEKAREG